jgi:endo-1,4-beta-xylanase
VYENDLKDFGWGLEVKPEELAKKQAQLDRAFAWLAERRIAVRGHYLMQVAVPPNLAKMADDAPRVRAHVLGSAEQRLRFVGDRVTEWDVINHPIAWGGADLFSKRPGLERLDRDVFDLARRLTKLPLLVNEDQVYRPGAQCDGTYEYIAALLRDGYPVAGLGNQAHFHESYLPSPQHILDVTDRFAKLVPQQVVTEYDVVTNADEQLAADFTRDMLIACFSHPAYSGFMLWGFWENSHWKPEAASWNRDWTIRGRGEVLEEWIGRRWRTELTATTDSAGRITWRGFPGVYEVRCGEAPPMLTNMIRAAGDGAEVKLP